MTPGYTISNENSSVIRSPVRIANLDGRAVIVRDDGFVDIATASQGRFSPSTLAVIAQLDDVRAWFELEAPGVTTVITSDELECSSQLGPVVAAPSQIFAVGLNYRTHAAEMGLTPPAQPMIFAKFASSLAGPNAAFPIVSPRTDWEAELVLVIGRGGRDIALDDALGAIAGYCVGQDVSDRDLQMAGSPAQFSLGKSHRNFAPVGPWITTRDEVSDPNRLRIECQVNGVTFQDSTTQDMVFTVPEIVSYVSMVCELRPGDLIFTGSPHGVGQGQKPPVFLRSGDHVVTTIAGLGTIRNDAE